MERKETSEDLAERLARDPDYRILRRLRPAEIDPFAGEADWPVATILDVETTGRDAAVDRVVELALLSFRYQPRTGEVTVPVAAGSWLIDPERPIPEAMTAIHGIADADVAGRRLDVAAARRIVAPSTLVVSHKSDFDRPFADRLGIGTGAKPWACSLREVNWQARGFDGSSMHPLAAQVGLFSARHRAPDDCAMLHALLSRNLVAAGPGEPDLAGIMDDLDAARRRVDVALFAVNSPYAHKDALRERGYRWNDGGDGRPKAWWKVMEERLVDEEEAFLLGNYVTGTTRLPRIRLDSTGRHRDPRLQDDPLEA